MKRVIGPVELYAVGLARCTWHECLVQGKSICFVDSYAALDSCIKGTSTNDKFRRLLLAFEEADLAPARGVGFRASPQSPTQRMTRRVVSAALC